MLATCHWWIRKNLVEFHFRNIFYTILGHEKCVKECAKLRFALWSMRGNYILHVMFGFIVFDHYFRDERSSGTSRNCIWFICLGISGLMCMEWQCIAYRARHSVNFNLLIWTWTCCGVYIRRCSLVTHIVYIYSVPSFVCNSEGFWCNTRHSMDTVVNLNYVFYVYFRIPNKGEMEGGNNHNWRNLRYYMLKQIDWCLD